MDRNTREHFEKVIELAHAKLTDIHVVQNDISISRAILQLRGNYRSFEVWLKEIQLPSGNIYSYYVIEKNQVVVGFDNYPDAQVLKAKFGRGFRSHSEDRIPHRHGPGKRTVSLTDSIDAKEFLALLPELTNY